MMTLGVCRNPACPEASDAKPIERYPGPGEFCPNCGEPLDPLPSSAASDEGARTIPAPPPTVQVPPSEALLVLERSLRTGESKPSRRLWAPMLIAMVAIIIVGALVIGVVGPMAAHRAGVGMIRVCGSSITERLAGDVVSAYVAKSHTPASRFDVTGAGACDVRFSAGRRTASGQIIGHDAIVVIVNPQNPVTHLSEDEVRGIFTGTLKDWSELGGEPGPIAAMIPPDTTDEVQALSATLLHRAGVSAGIGRLASSYAVVQAITSAHPSARGMIGVVAFSASTPAKVLTLGSSPAPSVLSIAAHRYPLSVAVTVAPGRATSDSTAVGLLRFARSDEAQSVIVRDGLVAKQGF